MHASRIDLHPVWKQIGNEAVPCFTEINIVGITGYNKYLIFNLVPKDNW